MSPRPRPKVLQLREDLLRAGSWYFAVMSLFWLGGAGTIVFLTIALALGVWREINLRQIEKADNRPGMDAFR